MKASALCLLLLLVTTCADGGKYCCFPDQYEATMELMSADYDAEGNFAITIAETKGVLDYRGQRIHNDVHMTVGNDTIHYQILQLFHQKKQYLIRNGVCHESALQPLSNDNCIPDNATLASVSRLGLQQAILVKEYVYTKGSLNVGLGVTANCTPVTTRITGAVTAENTTSHVFQGQTVDQMTVGISDPSIFNVPDICKHPTYASADTVFPVFSF